MFCIALKVSILLSKSGVWDKQSVFIFTPYNLGLTFCESHDIKIGAVV